jgi:hypothetical protein
VKVPRADPADIRPDHTGGFLQSHHRWQKLAASFPRTFRKLHKLFSFDAVESRASLPLMHPVSVRRILATLTARFTKPQECYPYQLHAPAITAYENTAY